MTSDMIDECVKSEDILHFEYAPFRKKYKPYSIPASSLEFIKEDE